MRLLRVLVVIGCVMAFSAATAAATNSAAAIIYVPNAPVHGAAVVLRAASCANNADIVTSRYSKKLPTCKGGGSPEAWHIHAPAGSDEADYLGSFYANYGGNRMCITTKTHKLAKGTPIIATKCNHGFGPYEKFWVIINQDLGDGSDIEANHQLGLAVTGAFNKSDDFKGNKVELEPLTAGAQNEVFDAVAVGK